MIIILKLKNSQLSTGPIHKENRYHSSKDPSGTVQPDYLQFDFHVGKAGN